MSSAVNPFTKRPPRIHFNSDISCISTLPGLMSTEEVTPPPSPHDLLYTLWPPPVAQPADDKTVLPGFGRPLNYFPQVGDLDYIRNRFPSALSRVDRDHERVVYVAP